MIEEIITSLSNVHILSWSTANTCNHDSELMHGISLLVGQAERYVVTVETRVTGLTNATCISAFLHFLISSFLVLGFRPTA